MRIDRLAGLSAMNAALAGALGAGLAAGSAAAQGAAAPTATYWVTADTNLSKIAPSPFGGNAGAARLLSLQLSSGRTVAGAPSAEHLPPSGLSAGAKLPLTTPKAGPPANAGSATGVQGRVLVYWGCGEQLRSGQPLAIDLARPGTGSAAALTGFGPFAPAPPSPGSGRTYGEWPGPRAVQLGPRASLVGEHLVRGNYTPDIGFTLADGQDFMAPLALSGTARNSVGAMPLKWSQADRAGGYFVSVVGASESGDTVIWTSSEAPALAGQVPDHLSPADLKRLVARKVVLGPAASGCTIPAEVAKAAPASILRVVALGGEADFSFPPRPSDPKAPWKPDYAVKVRYASIASAMLGLDEEPADPEDAGAGEDPDAPAPASLLGQGARGLMKGLGSIGR